MLIPASHRWPLWALWFPRGDEIGSVNISPFTSTGILPVKTASTHLTLNQGEVLLKPGPVGVTDANVRGTAIMQEGEFQCSI